MVTTQPVALLGVRSSCECGFHNFVIRTIRRRRADVVGGENAEQPELGRAQRKKHRRTQIRRSSFAGDARLMNDNRSGCSYWHPERQFTKQSSPGQDAAVQPKAVPSRARSNPFVPVLQRSCSLVLQRQCPNDQHFPTAGAPPGRHPALNRFTNNRSAPGTPPGICW